MKFRSKYSEKTKVKSNSGERFKKTYSLGIDDYGHEVLKQTGVTDLKEEIQSHHDSVALDMILMRFMQGDEKALDKVQGFYADVSQLPVKLNDVLNMAREGKNIFDELPTEIKEKFGNDYMAFLSNPELIANIGKDEKEEVVKAEEEVKPNDEQE